MERTALVADRPATAREPAPLVHILRGPHVESVHFGHVAVVDARGNLLAWAGDPHLMVFPRSSFKPFQALPLVESGAFARSGLGSEALALIAGSHGGTDHHAEIARAILEKAGVGEEALSCGAHIPYDEETAEAMRRRGEEPTPVRNNCSGKHAGMLLLARDMGAPLAGYVDPSHPVQRRIFERFEELLGEPMQDREPAIDGCSAPTPRFPLSTLARAFALLASGRDAAGHAVPGLETIRDAMCAHPENVAGSGRLDTRLMRAMSGAVVSKGGAEGVHATGHVERGVGIAIKVADGSRRALGPAAVAVLTQMRILGEADRAALAPVSDGILRNHAGVDVGAVRSVVQLTGAAR